MRRLPSALVTFASLTGATSSIDVVCLLACSRVLPSTSLLLPSLLEQLYLLKLFLVFLWVGRFPVGSVTLTVLAGLTSSVLGVWVLWGVYTYYTILALQYKSAVLPLLGL